MVVDVDHAALDRATQRLAAMAPDVARWEKPAAPVAFAAWALRESGHPAAAGFYDEAVRLATGASGASFLQRASLYLVAESQRGLGERDPVAPLVLRSLRDRLGEPGALAKLPIFVMGQALEATGRMGDPHPALRDALLAKRRDTNGSFEDRPWVTALALSGLVHGRCKGTEIARTRDWLERQVSGDGTFADKLGEIPDEVSTAYCTLALLQAESGEDHPPVMAAANRLMRGLDHESRPLPLALSLLVLRLIGRYEYARVESFDRHKVVAEIHHNYKQEVTHVHGDVVHGGKTHIEGSTLVRSNVGGAGEGGKVAIQGSTVVRSEVGGSDVRRIVPEAGPKYCSACGEALAGSGRFCGGCGAAILPARRD